MVVKTVTEATTWLLVQVSQEKKKQWLLSKNFTLHTSTLNGCKIIEI